MQTAERDVETKCVGIKEDSLHWGFKVKPSEPDSFFSDFLE